MRRAHPRARLTNGEQLGYCPVNDPRSGPRRAAVGLPDMQRSTDKPSWVEALEESLLLAIGLFSLITWIVTLGILSH